jgi:adenosine deaminase
MNLRQIPKVELHLHLDCSLSFDVVSRIVPKVTLEEYTQRFIAPAKCTNLADFLTRAPAGIRLMQTEQQLRLVTEDLFRQLVDDHILYAEIRFAPLLHTEGVLRPKDVVDIVEQATIAAIESTGIEARLLLCTLRHFSRSESLETVQLVQQFRGTKVVGFDIAADEAGYPIDEHIPAFRFAQDHAIPCTAHAGEARGADSVWETLRQFRPLRIGHGVRSMEDSVLLEHLQKENIHLEVCPTSNIQTDIYSEMKDHPIGKLYNMGISVGVNTDARTLSNTSLTEEYQKLHLTFGWTKEHFLRCNLNALHSSFLPQTEKRRLLDRLTDEYQGLDD